MPGLRWLPEEDAIVRRLYPDYAALIVALPTRTRYAIKFRVQSLNLATKIKVKSWTGAELKRLRQACEARAHKTKIIEMFAPRNWEAIYSQIKRFKINRRRIRSAPEFRHPAVLSIRERSYQRNLPFRQLAREIGGSELFGVTDSGTSIAGIIKAVEFLGGEIDIIWSEPDQ